MKRESGATSIGVLATISVGMFLGCLSCDSSGEEKQSASVRFQEDSHAYQAGCNSSSDCNGGVCLRLGSESACYPQCSTGGTSCSGSAQCNQVTMIDVNYCADKSE